MPQNRQHHRKAKYPDKVAKPKSLVFVRIFLFRSAGSKITYFPTAPSKLTQVKVLHSYVLFHQEPPIQALSSSQ